MITRRTFMTTLTAGMASLAGCGKPPAADRQVLYTCPMHPEVVKNAPGTCPKCGMALVEKEAKASGRVQP